MTTNLEQFAERYAGPLQKAGMTRADLEVYRDRDLCELEKSLLAFKLDLDPNEVVTTFAEDDDLQSVFDHADDIRRSGDDPHEVFELLNRARRTNPGAGAVNTALLRGSGG